MDPISKVLLGEIEKYAEQQQQIKAERQRFYWIKCPACGKRVVKKELIKKGCYVCGWKGTEEEIELAKIEGGSTLKPYRTNCSQCGTRVITEEFLEKGCYICGYKPEEPLNF